MSDENEPWVPTHRAHKSGAYVRVLLYVQDITTGRRGAQMVVYRGVSGGTWTKTIEEFDKQFYPIPEVVRPRPERGRKSISRRQYDAICEMRAAKLGSINHPDPERSAREGRNVRIVGWIMREEDAGLSDGLFLLDRILGD